ncbi:uncharacterized protein LAESUDRAFT_666546 [Laetiporus sulphureus 93-53]|uniref:Uncharacterized protein n=1 Tax=Laetiporus sulphureus 93-53 TaxID=1314785 RepID=A0A165B4S2_9APHY|nr:uncharacterized protein LAESUDRAFT_666546 [Laetiporus sulphureus 93-53]KZT00236.1 hypothetical protein LAESUDRAFT_666546 [Laetiporus sulphureus 93-53]
MSSSAEVYAEQLLRRCEGYPLWAPEVSEHGEVLIGDVGVVERGAFIRMFNTTRDANDEANRHGVPPEHIPFNPAAWSHRRRDNVFGGGFLCSEFVRKVTVDVSAGAQVNLGLQFECNHERGACLIVEDQGTREEVTGRRLKNYIRENMPKWYQWAVDKLDADVKLEDLMFVKGWVKTTRWTVAVFTQQARNVQFTIDAEVGAVVDAKVKFATSESQSPQYDQRTGPPERTIGRGGRRQNHGKNRPQTAYPQDQCILLHYFKLKKRWIGTKIMAAAEPKDLPPYSDDDFEVEEVPSKDEVSCTQ